MNNIAQSWNQHANLFKKMNNNHDIDLSTPNTDCKQLAKETV